MPEKPMPACHLKPEDKKRLLELGEELVRRHGNQKYYKPFDIRRAAESRGYPIDIHCWAYSIFTTPQDFKNLHDAAGEACDYAAMKAEVLTDLARQESLELIGISLSWLEWRDIDLSSLFDWFDFS